MDKDGFARLVAGEGLVYNGETARKHTGDLARLSREPVPFLFDIRKIAGMDDEALSEFAGRSDTARISKMALIIGGLASARVAEQFIQDQSFPVRLFYREKEARGWLALNQEGHHSFVRSGEILPFMEKYFPLVALTLAAGLILSVRGSLTLTVAVALFIVLNVLSSKVIGKLNPAFHIALEHLKIMGNALYMVIVPWYFTGTAPLWTLLFLVGARSLLILEKPGHKIYSIILLSLSAGLGLILGGGRASMKVCSLSLPLGAPSFCSMQSYFLWCG